MLPNASNKAHRPPIWIIVPNKTSLLLSANIYQQVNLWTGLCAFCKRKLHFRRWSTLADIICSDTMDTQEYGTNLQSFELSWLLKQSSELLWIQDYKHLIIFFSFLLLLSLFFILILLLLLLLRASGQDLNHAYCQIIFIFLFICFLFYLEVK